jgi:hypothetical protein
MIVSTLADQFHDTFEPYYSGKKTGWVENAQERSKQNKSSATKQGSEKEAPKNPPVTESRH